MLRVWAILVGVLLFTSSFTTFSNVYSQESSLPEWVKNIFVWFAEDVVSESELLGAIEWLVENKIIRTSSSANDEFFEEYKSWAKGEISKFQDYSEQLKSKLDYKEKENQELKDDIAFLESRIASLSTSLRSSTQEKTELKTTIKTQQETAERDKIESLADTNPLVQGLISGQLKFYIEPVPSYASTQVADVVDSITVSLEKAPFYGMKFQRVYNPADANLHISWIKDYGSHTVGQAIFKSVVKIGVGKTNCHGDWQAFDGSTVLKILWHELGHSLGFGHSNDPSNIMYYSTDIRFNADYEKTKTLDEGEYTIIKFCNDGLLSIQASTNSEYDGFYVYVLPPETNAGNFVNYNQGNYYGSCSREGLMSSYSDTCNVPDGSQLLLYNKNELLSFDAIRIDVKIIDLNERKNPDFTWDLKVFQYDQTWLNDVWNMYH